MRLAEAQLDPRMDAILERLQSVRHSGNGWIARCPAHPDRNPSLSIREGRDGRILLHCFAGCTVEAICSALKTKVSDLFAEPCRVQQKPRIVREAERQIADLRSRFTPSARALPVTIVYCEPQSLDEAVARALALTVEGEIVQCVLGEAK